MSKKKKRKIPWQAAILFLVFVALGGFCGVMIAEHMDTMSSPDTSPGQTLFYFAGMVLVLFLLLFLQIVVHEGGHLVFGLLSGYKFSSFRVASFMWVKQEGKLRFKRLSLAGTGGQCLMDPPDMVDGKLPVILYNLGGSILNLISAALCLILWRLTLGMAFWPVVFLMSALIGLVYALVNGIPLRLGAVDNDGHNALALGKDPAALRSFWIQMKMAALQAQGVRLRDMPQEWFEAPDEAGMQNSLTAVLAVFRCNRLMDEHKFQTAREEMADLVSGENALMGIYQNLLTCDLIYCECLFENRPQRLERMLTKGQKKFMKNMKKFPSVLRTQYAYALLGQGDRAEAEKIEAQFQKVGRSYPYPVEWEGERELMDLAKARA
ncbi:MAG: M50 family metallopeptidase, partial [Ruminiclostridium sp.]|nr:M50 family metallopeptidase [Ruminiclostridium sp.]